MALMTDDKPWKDCLNGCVHYSHCPYAHDYDAQATHVALTPQYKHINKPWCKCPGCSLHSNDCGCEECGRLKHFPAAVLPLEVVDEEPEEFTLGWKFFVSCFVLAVVICVIVADSAVAEGLFTLAAFVGIVTYVARTSSLARWRWTMCQNFRCAHNPNMPCGAKRTSSLLTKE